MPREQKAPPPCARGGAWYFPLCRACVLSYMQAMKFRAVLLAMALCLFPALVSAADLSRPDLALLFDERGLDGCFVVKRGADVIRVNPQRAAQAFRPASTFKIVNALVALEGGVAPGADFMLRWDGVLRGVPAWNADLSLEQAFRVSAVWYFVELARMSGRERLGAAMRELSYGNAEAAGSDRFWLDGPLRISADGQVRVLERLACGETSFSERSMGLLRQMMREQTGLDAQGRWALYVKTGLAEKGGGPGAGQADAPVGWLVGFVERGGQTFPFALNISVRRGGGRTTADLFPARMEIVRAMLDRLSIVPLK